MTKIQKFLSTFVVLSAGLFLSISNACADIAGPYPKPYPAKNQNGDLVVIIAGVGVVLVALISWVIIVKKLKKR